MRDVESFHFAVDARVRPDAGLSGAEIPISYVGDVLTPDRVRGTLSVSLGFFTLEIETITIGEAAYTTDPQTGEWGIASDPISALPNPVELTGADTLALNDATLVGEETLDGERVYRLRGAPPPATVGGVATADFWIGVEDFLIRQITAEGSMALEDVADALGGGGLSGTATLSMTITFSRYGEPVVIEAPEVDGG